MPHATKRPWLQTARCVDFTMPVSDRELLLLSLLLLLLVVVLSTTIRPIAYIYPNLTRVCALNNARYLG